MSLLANSTQEKGEVMKELLKALKAQSIISSQEIVILREQLKEQYPHYTNVQRAQIFAKIVQQKLDQALSPFKEDLRKKIKFYLLKETIHREQFSINACDVVKSYFQIETISQEPLDILTSWVNQYNCLSVTAADLTSLASTSFSLAAVEDPVEVAVPLPFPTSPLSFEALRRQLLSLWQRFQTCILPIRLLFIGSVIACCLALVLPLMPNDMNDNYSEAFAQIGDVSINCPITLDLEICANYLQEDLQYKPIDTDALRAYLTKKNSLLATEPYFSSILEAAKEFNVSPLLLFAITGQEQGFVPTTNPSAAKIANNPFNVYGSWTEYNTSIKQSARIAAQTVIHLGKGCPDNEDQIAWINTSYAEDPDWHIGVTYFFNDMKEVASLQ